MEILLEIRYAIEQEKNSGNCGELPVIACPQVVMLQYQTIDVGCIISTNRDTYLQIREYGEDISSLSQDRKDKYLLSTICEDSAQPEIMEAKAAVEREKIEYMIVRANAGMEQYMENLDFSFVAQTQSYMIYRNNYPWFQMPTNEAEVENRKDAMGLHENEIIMDLGLEKEYTIVTLNDLHVIALDETVTELWGSQCLYQPEEMTQEFLDMLIADNSPVRAIVSGHLHFPFVIDINENITEYVMAPAYRGEIGIIHIQ